MHLPGDTDKFQDRGRSKKSPRMEDAHVHVDVQKVLGPVERQTPFSSYARRKEGK